MADLSHFAPGLVAALAASLALGGRWSRIARIGRLHGIATLASVGLIVAITLSPTGPLPPDTAVGTCDLSRFGLRSIEELTSSAEASLNLILFVPLGVFLGLMPASTAKRLAIAGAFATPVVIELVQVAAPVLGRYCDSLDVADNLTGLVVGFVVGSAVDVVARTIRRPAPPIERSERSSEGH